MRLCATLNVEVEFDVYRDIAGGYGGSDDEITAQEVEAFRIGDVDIWDLIDAKAREQINNAIAAAFDEEITDAVAETDQ